MSTNIDKIAPELTDEEMEALNAVQHEEDGTEERDVQAGEGHEEEVATEEHEAGGDADGEADGEAAAGEEREPEKVRMVPHQAMHEERERRKEAEANNAKLMERIDQMLGAIQQNNSAPQEAPPKQEVPDQNKDPAAYLNYQIEQQQAQIGQLTKQHQYQQQVQQANAYVQSVGDFISTNEAEFMAVTPDYEDATKYAVDSYKTELIAAGRSEEQASAELQRIIFETGATCARQGKNPAETFYAIAKARGYQPKSAQTTEAEKIAEMRKAGKATDMSLSKANGGAVARGQSLEQVANMSAKDFNSWFDKNGDEGFKALFLS